MHPPWLLLCENFSTPDILGDTSAQACGNAHTMVQKTAIEQNIHIDKCVTGYTAVSCILITYCIFPQEKPDIFQKRRFLTDNIKVKALPLEHTSHN